MNSRFARIYLIYVVVLGLALAIGAAYFSFTQGDLIGLLFRNILTGPVTLGIVSWSLLTTVVRWLTIGKMAKHPHV